MSDLRDRSVVMISTESLVRLDKLLRVLPEDWSVLPEEGYAKLIMRARQELGLSLHEDSSVLKPNEITELY